MVAVSVSMLIFNGHDPTRPAFDAVHVVRRCTLAERGINRAGCRLQHLRRGQQTGLDRRLADAERVRQISVETAE